MKYNTGRFITHDGLTLFTRSWKPDTAPKAAIVIVHGAFEHSGRYQHVAEWFLGHEYSVYAYDLRGHGESEGERAFVKSFHDWTNDLDRFIALIRGVEYEKKIYILGHSTGAAILADYLIERRPEHIKGVIFSSPTVRLSKAVSFFARTFSVIVGCISPGTKLKKLDTRFISRDEEAVKAYNNDPLTCNDGMRAGAVKELIKVIGKIQRNMKKITLPMLVIHGTADMVCDIAGSKELARKTLSDDKTAIFYEGYYHELFNDIGKERVFHDVLCWLDRRTIGC